ncbi:MAG: single-stranded-DNA-specific exonuclease RecJ [Clostridia bacterium]
MQKVWNLKKYDEEYIKSIVDKYSVSVVMAKLIASRNIPFNEIDNFLNGDISYIKDPFLIKDMDKFVKRMSIAKEKCEKVCIYGDYDVDGITSITIMYNFLKSFGIDVSYYLPDRLVEGYGINNSALDYIAKTGVTLIITVDCGVSAINEVEYAKRLGIDICITDHHECPEKLPDAYLIVNPKQKGDKSFFKMHAGVGVAFKCLMALAKSQNMPDESYLKYLDIVAIGTISDIVPLVDENRIISKYGLQQLKTTKNIGLKALLDIVTFKDIDSIMVSFGMAPRINACGRMGNAGFAVELLLEEDMKKAEKLSERLDKLNSARQAIEKEIFDQAVKIIEENNMENKSSIILYDKNWHNGVIGIVASRLVNMFYKPVILLTKEKNVIRGSGRCPLGFSLYDCLSECKADLIQFGGHELAAGLSISEDKIAIFKEHFEQVASKRMKDLREPSVDVDVQIYKKDLNIQLIKDIRGLKPYGQSNPTPLFLYKGLKIQSLRTLKEDKHLKFTLQDSKSLIDAIAFSLGNRRDEILIGDKIDVIAQVDVNVYNGKRTIQLLIKDFKKSVI